ncbi:uncharacterized protein [Equus caballus]|uniref:uncharacterized protein n=1 Tax=Equus caballus TaxID=9796 RepID=UPI0038B260F6
MVPFDRLRYAELTPAVRSRPGAAPRTLPRGSARTGRTLGAGAGLPCSASPTQRRLWTEHAHQRPPRRLRARARALASRSWRRDLRSGPGAGLRAVLAVPFSRNFRASVAFRTSCGARRCSGWSDTSQRAAVTPDLRLPFRFRAVLPLCRPSSCEERRGGTPGSPEPPDSDATEPQPSHPHRHTPSSAVQARESCEDWRPYYRPQRCERFRRHPTWFTSGSELTRFTGFPHPVLTHPQTSSTHLAKRENRAKTEWKPKIWRDCCRLGSVAPT